jgi:hypothetical protein
MDRYDNAVILYTSFQDKPYYRGKQYPNIPLYETDVYVITTIGDRLDLLAHSYYNDPKLWWVISMANNNITNGSLFPQPGTQLRIPTNLSTVLEVYNQFNQAR